MTRIMHTNLVNTTGSYQDALKILASRRRPVRPVNVASREPVSSNALFVTPDLRGTPSITGMRRWLRVLGHSDDDIKSLNVIHVAGTKGKGSTCAFTESFLRQHGLRTGFPRKTGLYTSPHLVLPEERIRINFGILSQQQFAKYFFEVYNALQHSEEPSKFETSPRLLQLWALVAFHTFIREQVDVAIIETHHGGEYDATNFLQSPLATVITTLGMDHVDQLGPELSNIAWHKSGILKTGSVAITASQMPEAAEVIRQRAAEKKVHLIVADDNNSAVDLAHLPSKVLRTNCNVALLAANEYLRQTQEGQKLTVSDIQQGISNFSWPGRFQVVRNANINWYLDAAHNELSMEVAAQWFAEATDREIARSKNILLFSHISTHRDGSNVLRKLLATLREYDVSFDGVVFSTYNRIEDDDSPVHDISLADKHSIRDLHDTYIDIWLEYYPKTSTRSTLSIDKAAEVVQELGRHDHTQVLTTGSQHLLGGILQIIQKL